MEIINGLTNGLRLLARKPTSNEPELSAELAFGIQRIFGQSLTVAEVVNLILNDVKVGGDAAVQDYNRRIDGSHQQRLEIEPHQFEAAYRSIPKDLAEALLVAAQRIKDFHQASMPHEWQDTVAGYGMRLIPIERVGLYVPGGTAVYPSTVLMSAIPAKIAGVSELILCTPSPEPATLAAAYVAGIDRVFGVGGAQAIGAMAHGTETIPKVDKICGPGNLFVTEAKRAVYGQVGIDGLYGPTETLLIADDSADPSITAADMLAQAEHDEMASPILITTSPGLANAVTVEIQRQLVSLDRSLIASAAIEGQGIIVVVESIEHAVVIANAFAPEHLCLLVENPESYVSLIKNAGGIFVGAQSAEVMGDYVAGPSHTMPTSATARYSASLGVQQFLKSIPVVNLSNQALKELGPAAAVIARAEGFTAHARAVEMRLEGIGHLRQSGDSEGR